MKLQITDMRTGERHVIDGEDAHVEARLRLLYPGPTENVADGHLGNVIHAVARVQHVGVVPLEHGVPMPAPVTKSEPAPAKGAWTVDEKGWNDVEHWPALRGGYDRTVMPIEQLQHMGLEAEDAECSKHLFRADGTGGCREYVAKLAHTLKTKPFAPVVAHPDTHEPGMHVANDGNHRIAAALLNGETHVPVALGKPTQKL